jgi:hypothetical protein
MDEDINLMMTAEQVGRMRAKESASLRGRTKRLITISDGIRADICATRTRVHLLYICIITVSNTYI